MIQSFLSHEELETQQNLEDIFKHLSEPYWLTTDIDKWKKKNNLRLIIQSLVFCFYKLVLS